MGLLVDGVWRDRWYDTSENGGSFVRPDSQFRNWVGSDSGFDVEANRYHLFVSFACPWAHRTLILRCLMGLEHTISVSSVHPLMGTNGWSFTAPYEDSVFGHQFLYELYLAAEPDYTGRVTVPILWDLKRKTIVNNESSEIVRMLDHSFRVFATTDVSVFYPPALRAEIDDVNAKIYDNVNNGVYRAGFATTQDAYASAVAKLFSTLDWLEERLSTSDYLVGHTLTEADIRLFVTLIRFDPVYVGHFKCNLKRLIDYPNLWAHTRRIYQLPKVAETVHLDHIKQHYYGSHPSINPSGVVPLGPDVWI